VCVGARADRGCVLQCRRTTSTIISSKVKGKTIFFSFFFFFFFLFLVVFRVFACADRAHSFLCGVALARAVRRKERKLFDFFIGKKEKGKKKKKKKKKS
jgi:hypothetical protein